MRIGRLMAATVGTWLLVGVPAMALELGDEAPPLNVKKWVKGGPVDLKEGRGKNVYVIEFWATWCGPCIRGIPHMTALQKKYRDQGVVVVSISSSDRSLEAVTNFVNVMGDRMGYVVGYEDKNDAPTDRAYMDGFKKEGIPQCFVVDKQGKIVWEGHPVFGLDEVLATILTGKYDIQKLREVGEKASKEKLEKLTAQREALLKYLEAAGKSADPKDSRALGEKAFAAVKNDPDLLNELSWTILTSEEIKGRDLELALRAAKLANELTEGKDFMILDTYARALFDNGKVQEAVDCQKKVLELVAADKDLRKQFEETLREYEQALKK